MIYSFLRRFKIKQSKAFIFSLMFILFLAASYPLLKSGLPIGHDLDYHLARIEGIKNEFLLFNFPIKINSSLLDGYGYANSLFYPDVFLYIPAFFRIIGITPTVSYKLFVLIINFFTILSCYLSLKYISRSRYAAMISTILFTLAQYRLSNVFIRTAVGEYIAFIFFPIIIAGVYDFLYCEFKKLWIILIGFTGLIFSHVISAVIAAIIVFVILLCHIKFILKNLNLFFKLIITGLITALITSFIWMPILEQILSFKFGFNKPWTFLSQKTVSFLYILDYDKFYSLGVLLTTVCAISSICIARVQKSKAQNKDISDKFLVYGFVITMMVTSLFPWRYLDDTILNSIQFPWRLLGFSSTFLAFSIAINMDILFKSRQARSIMLMLVFTVSSVFAVMFLNIQISTLQIKHFSDNYLKDARNVNVIGFGEWLPEGTDVKSLKSPYSVITESGTIIGLEDKNGSDIDFVAEQEAEYFDVPLLYYKGYVATIEGSDGTIYRLNTQKSENNNLVRVMNPQGLVGKVRVWYEGTAVQKISYTVSFITILILAVVYLYYRRGKHTA